MRSSRSTCGCPTPRRRGGARSDDPPSRHQPPHLRRPAAGHRDRAPRVPDAVVAGDVRARAVKPSGICLAARRDGRMCGYVVCSRYDTVWHIMNVAVDPDVRRTGVATTLLESLLERVGDKRARYTLEVRQSNAAAIEL